MGSSGDGGGGGGGNLSLVSVPAGTHVTYYGKNVCVDQLSLRDF